LKRGDKNRRKGDDREVKRGQGRERELKAEGKEWRGTKKER